MIIIQMTYEEFESLLDARIKKALKEQSESFEALLRLQNCPCNRIINPKKLQNDRNKG
ncbi:MAG: hypothetical protein RLZZ628_3206 [Bacteroidota bacterium]|jgi:hypothetical protein